MQIEAPLGNSRLCVIRSFRFTSKKPRFSRGS